MLIHRDTKKRNLLFWPVLLLVALWVITVAPEEQTLGQGIKSVYIHVALIWVGMVSLVVAGLLGVALVIRPTRSQSRWMQIIGWVGLAFYAAGVATSIVASQVNWGNVFWQEPRMRLALNMLAVIVIVEILANWVPSLRLQGLLSAGLATILVWSTVSAPLVLHPRNPISTSSSSGIQLTFLSLFLLTGTAAAWIVWHVRPAKDGRHEPRRTLTSR